jgi:hypothetical protein
MPISFWQKNQVYDTKIAYNSVREVNSINDRLAESGGESLKVKAER